MEEGKIEAFKAKHPLQAFPWFRTLGRGDVRNVYSQLCRRVSLPEDADGLSLVRALEHTGEVLEQADLKCFPQDIEDALSRHKIGVTTNVCVNWYRFDEIDELRFDDFLRWFPDLWYTAAEDPDIFDETLEWLLSIRHYGTFVLRRLG